VLDDLELAALLEQLELDPTERRRHHRAQVDHAWHRDRCTGPRGAADGTGDQRLVGTDGEPDRHPGALVDLGAGAQHPRQLGEHLVEEAGHVDRDVGGWRAASASTIATSSSTVRG
jgi:hypothetical protein